MNTAKIRLGWVAGMLALLLASSGEVQSQPDLRDRKQRASYSFGARSGAQALHRGLEPTAYVTGANDVIIGNFTGSDAQIAKIEGQLQKTAGSNDEELRTALAQNPELRRVASYLLAGRDATSIKQLRLDANAYLAGLTNALAGKLALTDDEMSQARREFVRTAEDAVDRPPAPRRTADVSPLSVDGRPATSPATLPGVVPGTGPLSPQVRDDAVSPGVYPRPTAPANDRWQQQMADEIRVLEAQFDQRLASTFSAEQRQNLLRAKALSVRAVREKWQRKLQQEQ